MIIVILQSKLLQAWNQHLWMWHTASGALLQHFTNTLKRWFVVRSDSSAVVSVHCCITIAVARLLNTISKSSVCNNATYASEKRIVCNWIRTTAALLHNHQMRNAHMCTLAIVMATCSSGGGAVIGYSLVLLLFRLGYRWPTNSLQATWWKCR